MHKKLAVALLFFAALFCTSCLTCERKEYIVKLTGPASGTLTIRYINIFSNCIDSLGEYNVDYDELIRMWLRGKKIEKDFPEVSKLKKRLYEENGQLCGEVTLQFKILRQVYLEKNGTNAPILFSLESLKDDGEILLRTNGSYDETGHGTITWMSDTKELRFTTQIAKPDSLRTAYTLVDMWRKDKSPKK